MIKIRSSISQNNQH